MQRQLPGCLAACHALRLGSANHQFPQAFRPASAGADFLRVSFSKETWPEHYLTLLLDGGYCGDQRAPVIPEPNRLGDSLMGGYIVAQHRECQRAAGVGHGQLRMVGA